MTMRSCSTVGCPGLVKAGGRTGRCAKCEREADQARGTRQERGYDAGHDAVGREYQLAMDAGRRFRCWRCNRKLGPIRGVDWMLGHCDIDRAVHHGPECPPCNLATQGRSGCPHASHAT